MAYHLDLHDDEPDIEEEEFLEHQEQAHLSHRRYLLCEAVQAFEPRISTQSFHYALIFQDAKKTNYPSPLF